MKKLSLEEIEKRLLYKNIKIIGNYINGNFKTEFECLKCNNIWKTMPNCILKNNGSGCPNCYGNIKLTNEIIDNKLINRNIQRIDEYKHALYPINFKCLTCNHIWQTTPNKITNKKTGCPNCYGNVKLTNEIIDNKLINRNIQRIDEYKNIDTPIKFKCLNKNCLHIWTTTPYHIINRNQGCPKCKTGKNEKLVMKLIYHYVKYDIFKYHKSIIINDKRFCPDFYLEINNKKIIIEYNGEQHYKPVRFCGISIERANKNFEKQKIRDFELKEYCNLNNIKLLEIPYYWNEKQIINNLLNL